MQYSNNSPYAKVKQTWYLHYSLPRRISPSSSDEIYTIPNEYHEQPWRLSYELYGTERLYYIFALVNPNLLVDPVYDFVAGKTIRVPSKERIYKFLSNENRSI